MMLVAKVKRNQARVNPDRLEECPGAEKARTFAGAGLGKPIGKSGGILREKLFHPWVGRKKIVKGRAAFYNYTP
ncbi:MAG: hypothetical protein FWD79_11885 [Desulfobulbus sp.]|nr:hypothetical protein [Desulfobulbus sp.]